jgi:hypothetical protein
MQTNPDAKEPAMNSTFTPSSPRDGIIAAIGVVVLLIGTATGNAIVMLIMAMVALAVIAVAYRDRIGRKVLLTIVAAASIGCAVAMAIANL